MSSQYESLEALKQLNNKVTYLRWTVQGEMNKNEAEEFVYDNKIEPLFFELQKIIELEIRNLEAKFDY